MKIVHQINIVTSLILMILGVSLMLNGCSDAKSTERILYSAGFTKVQTTGYSFLGCGKDDWYSTGFSAISVNGTPVSGAVCAGIMKKGTIRLD